MINPKAITNYQRSESELQTFWLFCIIVAGRNSDFAAQKVSKLLSKRGELTPFQYLKENEINLHNLLVVNKVGQYTRIERAIKESLDLDLNTATLGQLMGVFGVGPKTARFFLLHSRPESAGKIAVLDTHILKWLRSHGVDCPSSTPQEPIYSKLESQYLFLTKSLFPDINGADLDLMLWAKESGRVD